MVDSTRVIEKKKMDAKMASKTWAQQKVKVEEKGKVKEISTSKE